MHPMLPKRLSRDGEESVQNVWRQPSNHSRVQGCFLRLQLQNENGCVGGVGLLCRQGGVFPELGISLCNWSLSLLRVIGSCELEG